MFNHLTDDDVDFDILVLEVRCNLLILIREYENMRCPENKLTTVRLSVGDVTEENSHFLFPLNPKKVRNDLVIDVL